MEWGDTIYTGLFYRNDDAQSLGEQEPVLDQNGPISGRPLGLSSDQAEVILSRML